MPERPPDPELEASTNRWMIGGLALFAVMVLAFPVYRWFEPDSRATAREQHLADLAAYGGELFQTNCVACHGQDATGGIGPALNSKQFLTTATDGQINSLISVGVPGSQMSAYSLDYGGPLTLAQIEALTAFLRSLEPNAPDNPDWRAMLGG